MRISHLSSITREHSVIVRRRPNACSPFGSASPGSTTSLAQDTLRASQEVQLMELLNSSESPVANLKYKSYTVLSTLITATKAIVVERYDIVTDEDGIKRSCSTSSRVDCTEPSKHTP